MLKRCVIFLFLATAYLVLLAHNFTPHHHNELRSGHHHEHDISHDHSHDHEKDQSDGPGSFQFLHHTGAAEVQYIPVHHVKLSVVESENITAVYPEIFSFITGFNEEPRLIFHRAREESPFLIQSLPYFIKLKAPPAFILA